MASFWVTRNTGGERGRFSRSPTGRRRMSPDSSSMKRVILVQPSPRSSEFLGARCRIGAWLSGLPRPTAGLEAEGPSTFSTPRPSESWRRRGGQPKSLSSDRAGVGCTLPEPPGLAALDPLLEIWPRGRSLTRCHNLRYGSRDFNPGHGLGRFHPFSDVSGNPVPTLYAADGVDGALSETAFHDVPARGFLKAMPRERLKTLGLSFLAPRRDLVLVQLHGFGLRRLGVTREELIASDAEEYLRTALWARALHACRPEADGLVWVSRQHDRSLCLVLFGDRVKPEDLRVLRRPRPLETAAFEHVERAAAAAGIHIID